MGVTVSGVTGNGTAQTGATSLDGIGGGNFWSLTTSGGNTAFVLPAGKPIGYELHVYNTTSTTALIFPESGAQISGGGANNSFSVAQNKVCHLIKVAALTWAANLSA
jgi:hypothetical protein